MLLASFGVLALMLAGCNSTDTATTDETVDTDTSVTDDSATTTTDDSAAVDATTTTDEVAE